MPIAVYCFAVLLEPFDHRKNNLQLVHSSMRICHPRRRRPKQKRPYSYMLPAYSEVKNARSKEFVCVKEYIDFTAIGSVDPGLSSRPLFALYKVKKDVTINSAVLEE